MTKKLLTIILSLFTCFAFSLTPSYASQEQSTRLDYFYSSILLGEKTYAINESGENITDAFLSATLKSYENGDYETIKKYISNQSITLVKDTSTQVTRDLTKAYSYEYYNLVNSTVGYHTIEITYRVSGNATCNNRGLIVSFTTPRFTALESSWNATSLVCTGTKNIGVVDIYLEFVPTWQYGYGDYLTTLRGSKIVRTEAFTPMSQV